MRYCFATLAVGNPYEEQTVSCYQELAANTEHCDFYIASTNTELKDLGEKIFVKHIDPYSLHDSRGGFSFHLNLKVLALKATLEKYSGKHYDYIIFADGDWRMHTGFQEQKILNMFEAMERDDIDFYFERPADIGGAKRQPNESFFKEKLYDYDVFDHTKWDTAHCVNEQFLVFRNSWKFKFFVQRWEMFLWYSIANDIRNYPDGFEIGVSALEADMKWNYQGCFHGLTDCFSFYTKLGDFHTRF